LVNSKVQFLIQKFLFFAFGPVDLAAHSAFGPAGSGWPRCPCRPKPPSPAHPARASVASLRDYVFPFGSCLPSWSLLPHLSVKRPRLSAPSLTSCRPSSAVPPPPPGHPAPPSSVPRVPPSRYHPAIISPTLNPPLNPPLPVGQRWTARGWPGSPRVDPVHDFIH
jgi:hypothetical protein